MKTSVDIAVSRLKGALRPEDVRPALRAAVKRTVTTYIARGSRQIAKTINLRIGEIKDQFISKVADDEKGAQALVTTKRKGVPLFEYLTSRQAMRASLQWPGGIKVKVRRGRGMERHEHSFVAVMKSGHVGIFHRGTKSREVAGAKRLPIYEERGPTAVGVFANSPDGEGKGSIFDATCADAADVLIKNIDQQTDRFLAKYAAQ
jgi:hypothetical protein